MASEHVIDLENQRYADIWSSSADVLVISPTDEERERAERQRAAFLRLQARAASDPVVADILTMLDVRMTG